MSEIEIHKIIKMVPQALFFIDERTEEILQQSKAMKAFFGQSTENILSKCIFELHYPVT